MASCIIFHRDICQHSNLLVKQAVQRGFQFDLYDIGALPPPPWLKGTPTILVDNTRIYCGSNAFQYIHNTQPDNAFEPERGYNVRPMECNVPQPKLAARSHFSYADDLDELPIRGANILMDHSLQSPQQGASQAFEQSCAPNEAMFNAAQDPSSAHDLGAIERFNIDLEQSIHQAGSQYEQESIDQVMAKLKSKRGK